MKPRQEFLALANVGKNTLRQQRGTPIGKTLSALGPPTLFPCWRPLAKPVTGGTARHGTHKRHTAVELFFRHSRTPRFVSDTDFVHRTGRDTKICPTAENLFASEGW